MEERVDGWSNKKDASFVRVVMAEGGHVRREVTPAGVVEIAPSVVAAGQVSAEDFERLAPGRTVEAQTLPAACLAKAGRSLRPVAPIRQTARLSRSPVPPPPKIAWLPLTALVVDDAYQRALSGSGIALIRRLVAGWDWNRFKPLSVAPTGGGLYEVVDGQHSAIAAATHGAIELLPCLVLDAATVQARAAAFVGINHERVALTGHALFRARMEAGDERASAVHAALQASGARLVAVFKPNEAPTAGSLSCVSTLSTIEKRFSGEFLTEILTICVGAGLAPIPAAVLRAVSAIQTHQAGRVKPEVLIEALKALGSAALMEEAVAMSRTGRAPTTSDGMRQLILKQVWGGKG